MKNFTKVFSTHSILTVLLVFCINVFYTNSLQAQSLSWQWAKQFGNVDQDVARSSAIDPWGNIYTTGYFRSTSIDFGGTTLNGNFSIGDIYLVKMTSAGNVIWAKSVASDDNDEAYSVAVDANGNAFVVGFFQSTFIDFGNVNLNNTNAPAMEGFIVKYDSSGSDLWAKRIGGPLLDWALTVQCDNNGGVYVGGSYTSDSLVFGNDVIYNYTPYDHDFYLAKYDENGNEKWIRSARGAQGGFVNDIAIHNSEVMVTGYFEGPFMAFNNNDSIRNTNQSSPSADLFLAKYDTAGNFSWAKSYGGFSHEVGTGIACDAAGNNYLTGYFTSINFPFGADTLYNSNNINYPFLVKTDASGNALWARGTSAQTYGVANSVCMGTLGDIVCTGWFVDSLKLGNNLMLTDSIGADMYVASYDAQGNVQWTTHSGGTTGYTKGNSISCDNSGNLVVSGMFECDTLDFSNTTLSNSQVGWMEIFVSKMHDDFNGLNTVDGTPQILNAWPNPSKGVVTIDVANQNPNSVYIFNQLGQSVAVRLYCSAKQTTIDFSTLPQGLYFIQLISNGKKYAAEVLITKQ